MTKGRGGARAGAGRRKNKAENAAAQTGEAPRKSLATEILESLGKDIKHPPDCKCQRCLWRMHATAIGPHGRDSLKYLWDRADGKPVDTVNHLHDKPIDINVNVSLSEAIQKARKRAAGK